MLRKIKLVYLKIMEMLDYIQLFVYLQILSDCDCITHMVILLQKFKICKRFFVALIIKKLLYSFVTDWSNFS